MAAQRVNFWIFCLALDMAFWDQDEACLSAAVTPCNG